MGLDVYLVRTDDWTEYDRAYDEYERVALGKDKDEELAWRLREKMDDFDENVTDEMPEEWRGPLGIPQDAPSWRIGYIAGSWARSFENVGIEIEWRDEFGMRHASFPYLIDIACGCYGEYCPNDWERTFSLGLRCLTAVNRSLIDIRKNPLNEYGEKRYIGDLRNVRAVLTHVIILAKLILATGEPQKYRVLYSD